jgi:zinc and cadmium transporter
VTFEQMLAWHHCQHHECENEEGHNHMVGNKSTAYSILVGDSLHNMVDGMVIASAFMTNPTLGWVATLAIVLHEVPHEIGDFGILIASGFSKFKAAMLNLLSALFAVAGALATYYFAQVLAYRQVFIAIAAGSFIYVALSDILPELQHHAKKRLWPTIVSLFVGVAIIWVMGVLLPDVG